jgi:hypothetical protein
MYSLEDYTTDAIRAEIHRREEADRAEKCWYCGMNLSAHTCKLARPSPVPGWEVQPPRYVRTEDCMGQEQEYWQVDARNPVTGKHAIGTGQSGIQATDRCVTNILRYQGK